MAETKNEKTQEGGLFLDMPRLTMENHGEVIRKLCEYSVGLQSEEDERKFIEWARNRFLKKVKDEYSDDQPMFILLNRIVWDGRFREMARDYFKEERKKRKKKRYCCC